MTLPYSGQKEFLAPKLVSADCGKRVVTLKEKRPFVLIKLIYEGPSLRTGKMIQSKSSELSSHFIVLIGVTSETVNTSQSKCYKYISESLFSEVFALDLTVLLQIVTISP